MPVPPPLPPNSFNEPPMMPYYNQQLLPNSGNPNINVLPMSNGIRQCQGPVFTESPKIISSTTSVELDCPVCRKEQETIVQTEFQSSKVLTVLLLGWIFLFFPYFLLCTEVVKISKHLCPTCNCIIAKTE